MKRPFEVGDRVRVYGNPPAVADEESIAEGTVEEVTREDRNISVRYDRSGKLWHVYPQQCRRLKPKTNKDCTRSHPHDGPCMGAKKEARRVWLYDLANEPESVNSIASAYTVAGPAPKVCAVPQRPINTAYTEFREVLPGEAVVTRETLAKAIQEYWQTPSDEPHTWAVCAREVAKALGLES